MTSLHDNGGRLYRVKVEYSSKRIMLFHLDHEEDAPYSAIVVNPPIFETTVDAIWVGCGTYNDVNASDRSGWTSVGNTVLAVSGHHVYVYGSAALSFDLQEGEFITKFVATVQNSGVPYAWIETDKGIYISQYWNCNSLDVGFIPWMHAPSNVGGHYDCVQSEHEVKIESQILAKRR